MCALKPEVDLRCVLQKTVSFDSLNYIEDATNAPAIPVEDFKFGYCLFPFTLNPGCTSDPGVFKKEGTVSVDLSFKAPPSKALSLVVMCVYDNTIRIDQDRNIQTDGF